MGDRVGTGCCDEPVWRSDADYLVLSEAIWGARECLMTLLIVGAGWVVASLVAALVVGRAMWASSSAGEPDPSSASSASSQSTHLAVGHVDDPQPLLGGVANVAGGVDQMIGMVGLDQAAVGGNDLAPVRVGLEAEDRVVV